MKEYLNSDEVFSFMKLLKLTNDIEEEFTINWAKRGNLKKDELKWLRTALTFLLKAIQSIIYRQDIRTRQKVSKQSKEVYFRLVDGYAEKRLEEKLNEKIKTAQEKDEYILELMELTIYMCCRNCTSSPESCHLYDYNCKKNIQEPSGEHYTGKLCRYGYEGKDIELKCSEVE